MIASMTFLRAGSIVFFNTSALSFRQITSATAISKTIVFSSGGVSVDFGVGMLMGGILVFMCGFLSTIKCNDPAELSFLIQLLLSHSLSSMA